MRRALPSSLTTPPTDRPGQTLRSTQADRGGCEVPLSPSVPGRSAVPGTLRNTRCVGRHGGCTALVGARQHFGDAEGATDERSVVIAFTRSGTLRNPERPQPAGCFRATHVWVGRQELRPSTRSRHLVACGISALVPGGFESGCDQRDGRRPGPLSLKPEFSLPDKKPNVNRGV